MGDIFVKIGVIGSKASCEIVKKSIKEIDSLVEVVSYEEEQQVVFRLCQCHGIPVCHHALLQQVNPDAIVLYHIACPELAASYHGIDTYAQFRQMERFGQIVVSSYLQSPYLVVERVLCRYYYHARL